MLLAVYVCFGPGPVIFRRDRVFGCTGVGTLQYFDDYLVRAGAAFDLDRHFGVPFLYFYFHGGT